jgi:cell division protein FtsW
MFKNKIKEEFQEYLRNIDKKILFCFLLLFFLGLFFSFSSTSSLAGERLNKDYYFFFSKHLLFVIISITIMIFFSSIKIEYLKKSSLLLFIIFFILLALVPVVGVEVKGAKRWLDFYFFRIQPIELLKPFFILVTAKILLLNKNKIRNTSYILSFCVLASIIIFLINQPDVGQSILLIGTWIAIVFISGVSIIYILSFLLISAASVISLILLFPQKFGYIFNRIVAFFDPEKGDSFQSEKALEAIRQGGIKGQGMGEGILKDRVPEAHTDYIIAVVSEEFGSLISISLIFIFLYLSFRIVKVCLKVFDEELRISLLGLASLMIFQTFIHIGVNTNLLPTTGMTLPFLSYGGSSLLGSAILAGIILNYTKSRFYNDEL